MKRGYAAMKLSSRIIITSLFEAMGKSVRNSAQKIDKRYTALICRNVKANINTDSTPGLAKVNLMLLDPKDFS